MRDEIEELFHEDEAEGGGETGPEDLNDAVERAQQHEDAYADAKIRRIAKVPWRDPDEVVPLDELLRQQHGPRRNRFINLPRSG